MTFPFGGVDPMGGANLNFRSRSRMSCRTKDNFRIAFVILAVLLIGGFVTMFSFNVLASDLPLKNLSYGHGFGIALILFIAMAINKVLAAFVEGAQFIVAAALVSAIGAVTGAALMWCYNIIASVQDWTMLGFWAAFWSALIAVIGLVLSGLLVLFAA